MNEATLKTHLRQLAEQDTPSAAAANGHQAMLDRFYCRLNLKLFVTNLTLRLDKPANRHRLTPEWQDFIKSALAGALNLLSPY